MLLTATHLTKTYGTGPGAARALTDVSIDIEPGSLAIMGPSGSGKTTLLHCLAGIVAPSSGSLSYRDHDLGAMSDRQRTLLRRSDFGFVFQSGQLLRELPADENVALPLLLAGTPVSSVLPRARDALARVGLAGLEARRPGELSGGQSQRVAIARALVTQPAVVFADEPTGALDQRTGAEVMDLLVGSTRAQGSALVVVTHDLAVARRCDRIVTMRDGLIVSEHRAPSAQQVGQVTRR